MDPLARIVLPLVIRARKVADVVEDLGSRREIEYAYRILAEGTSADRQLATFQRTGSLEAVVQQLVRETAEGVL